MTMAQGWWLTGLLALGLGLSPLAWADDPLDDTDGTEGWDQVVAPAATEEHRPFEPEQNDQDAFRREIADWESIRQTWEQEREKYVRERATHKRLASTLRPTGAPRSTMEINDANLDQATSPDADWGDAPGEQWLVPASSVDRAIDDELSETRPEAPARPRPSEPPPAPPPAALVPPPVSDSAPVPSAFRQSERQDLGGGLAPTSPNPNAPLPPSAPARAQKVDADAGAKAAAEMLRRQQEDERRRAEAERAQREREAAEGAAAAARLLQMQAEQERKEQEALRQKAGVKEDEDGQMVDPDLQREMDRED